MKVLPPSTGAPRRRDEGDRRPLVTHPRRSAVVFAVALLAAAVVPVAAVWGVRALASSTGGEITRTVPGDDVVENVLPDTIGALLVTVDPEGVVVGLTVFAPDPSGRGGTVVVVPATAATVGDDGAELRLGDAYTNGGLAAEQNAVENLLGISLPRAVEGGEAELTDLLRPLAPFTVTLNDRVVDTVDGDNETVASSGTRDLTAEDAAAILLARKEGESELARLARTASVWQAVVRQPGLSSDTATTVPTTDDTTEWPPGDMPGFLAALARGSSSVQTLPATSRVGADGAEVLDIPREYVHLLMAQVLPGAVSPADENARVRLVDPAADQFALLTATKKLDALPAHLVMANVGGQAAQAPRTILEYGTPVGQAAAEQLVASSAFGADAEVRAAAQRTRGIDLTVTLGADFRPEVDRERAATTTVPPSTTGDGEES